MQWFTSSELSVDSRRKKTIQNANNIIISILHPLYLFSVTVYRLITKNDDIHMVYELLKLNQKPFIFDLHGCVQ